MTETTLHRIGSLADLQTGKPMKAKVGTNALAVFMLADEVVVTNGRCPHARGPLHEGEIEGTVLTCPWHGWTYDLRTGACAEDPDLKLEIYPSSVVGDDIFVQL